MIDGSSSSADDVFLKRLKTGSPEPCLATNSLDQMIEDGDKACEKSRNILHNIVTVVDDLWRMKDGLYAAVLTALPEDGKHCFLRFKCVIIYWEILLPRISSFFLFSFYAPFVFGCLRFRQTATVQ